MTSLSSLSRSDATPVPNERALCEITTEIRSEVIPFQAIVGKSIVPLSEKIAADKANAFNDKDELNDDESEDSEARARRQLRLLQDDLPTADFECVVFIRSKLLKKMTKDYKSLSDSLSELQQHSIDGESPTFGRVVKMLASLVPLLIELEPYWKEPPSLYHDLAPRTKEMIDDTIKRLDEVGREIFQPVSIILASAGLP